MIEVCKTASNATAAEVASSDFFTDMRSALDFVRESLDDMEGGDWLQGCVTIYGDDGCIVDTFSADCVSNH